MLSFRALSRGDLFDSRGEKENLESRGSLFVQRESRAAFESRALPSPKSGIAPSSKSGWAFGFALMLQAHLEGP